MLKISYVLPCHNVEKYISDCLQSIYNQGIDENDFEIICVNDCSPDETEKVILEWQQQHKNLILLNHSENTMQGGARNTGLRAARGKYVWFIDPDDYIKKNCAKNLLEILEKNDLDLLVFDFELVEENGKFIERRFQNISPEICAGKTVFKKDDWYETTMYIWAKIAKRSFYFENDIFFYEKFHDEDFLNGARCFLKAKKIKYLPESIVSYRQREGSDIRIRVKTGLALASKFKLCVEFYKLFTAEKDAEMKQFLFSIVEYYVANTSIFKNIIYLSRYQRKVFYQKLKLISDLHLIESFLSKKMKFAVKFPRCVAFLHVIIAVPHKLKAKLR